MKAKRLVVVRYRQDRSQWEVDYLDPRDCRRHRPLFDFEAEAHELAQRVAQELTDGVPIVADRDIVLQDYALRWLESRHGDIAQRTYRSYRQSLNHYVLPALGHLRLREIRPRQVLGWLATLKRRGLAADTIRLAKAALALVLRRAVVEELVESNAVRSLGQEAAQGKITKAERQSKIRPLESVAQRDALLAQAAREWPYGVAFEVMAKAGPRPGETYAFRLEDLNLRARTLRVERALDFDRTLKPTKTYERRVLRLSSSLIESLRRHVLRLKEEALRRGWGEVTWLFPTEANTPVDEAKAAKAFRRALKAAGLPAHRVYDLRHTFASLMLMGGARLGYVSRQLGHKTAEVTLRWYARWIPDDAGDQAQADVLEPKLGTSGGQRHVSAGAGGGT